jgi:hypothetical protein
MCQLLRKYNEIVSLDSLLHGLLVKGQLVHPSPSNFVRYFNGTHSRSLMGNKTFIDGVYYYVSVHMADSSSVLINCGYNGEQM